MDGVAHTLHFGKVGESFEIQSNFRIREWRPANDSTDKLIAGSNPRQPYRFLYSSCSLDDNGPCNAGHGCHYFQIPQKEIQPKNFHPIRHPRILGRHVAPEVMVCVDAFVDHSLVILRSCSNPNSILLSTLASRGWVLPHYSQDTVKLFLGAFLGLAFTFRSLD